MATHNWCNNIYCIDGYDRQEIDNFRLDFSSNSQFVRKYLPNFFATI